MGVMDERSSRVFIGVSLLVLLWIGTYWVYDPDRRQRTPPISFAEPAEPASAGPPGPAPQSAGPVVPPAPEPAPERAPEPRSVAAPPGVLAPEPMGPPDRPVSTGPRVVAPTFREHTIRPGDTFATIARQYLGSASHSSAIARANPLKDPRRLRVGEVLRVPLDPDNIQGRVVLEDGTPADPVRPQPPSAVEYLVQPGDTLTKIAQAYYGSVRHADFIFNANRDTMATPDSLRLGQTLRLPPLPVEAGGAAGSGGSGDGG